MKRCTSPKTRVVNKSQVAPKSCAERSSFESRLLNGFTVSLLVASSAWTAFACTVPLGNGGGGDGDGDGDVSEPNDEEEFLTSCMGHECPSGTREGVREVCESSKVGARLLRRLTRVELENTLRDVFPEVTADFAGVELSQDPVSSLGFSTDAKVLVVNAPTFKNMLETAEGLADLVTAPSVLSTVLPCSTGAADAACAAEWVRKYGYRLFRRPLTPDEVTTYVNYHQSVAGRSDFATGAKWSLSVMMQSPYAFYRSEIGAATPEGNKLTQYELATNLAYTYSGSTPSPELLAKADAGQLSSPEALRAEAALLLEDGTHWDAARRFFREWLGYEEVVNKSRDDDPAFAEVISPLLANETNLFLTEILFNGGTAQSLMTANFTAINGPLSTFYGYGGVTGEEFVPVARPTGHGLGLIAQGSLLAATAHQAETSPTLRGLLFTERFLCVEPPPPPDIVPPLSEAKGIEAAKTTREKYELHHGVGGCANCHKSFDPYGFVFEQFDETGRMRETENGEPINTVSAVTLPDGTTQEFVSLEGLSQMVDSSDYIENCVSGLMATYFLSGGGGSNCLAEDSRRALAAGEITLKDYLISLAGSPHFSTRGL